MITKHTDEAKERYAGYDEVIQGYMQAVIDSLSKEDENFDNSWYIQLDLLAANLNSYAASKRIFEDESSSSDPNLLTVRQAFLIMNQSQNQIQAVLKSLGLTKMDKAKISNLNKRGDPSGGFDVVAYTRDLIS